MEKRAAADTAALLVPERPTLSRLREAAAGCRACPLWERGTQTVFGEGERGADVVFVGFVEDLRRLGAALEASGRAGGLTASPPPLT